MSLNKIPIYSPNFNPIKRTINQIKFIIFHYTGMKKESEAISRLSNLKSKVSSHYLIKHNGDIITLVPDLCIAWHAGVSSWKNFQSLNKYSIGIEISNPGHEFNYKKFSKKQIYSIIKLSKFLIRKYKIKPQNILGHSDIAPIRKKDPGEKFPWKYFFKNKIGFWHSLDQKKLTKMRGLKSNNDERKIFLQNLIIFGYSLKFLKDYKFSKIRSIKIITRSFQRRFRQELIDGIIDKECLIISENIVKKFK